MPLIDELKATEIPVQYSCGTVGVRLTRAEIREAGAQKQLDAFDEGKIEIIELDCGHFCPAHE